MFAADQVTKLEEAEAVWSKRDPMSEPQSIEWRFRARRFARVATLIEHHVAETGRCRILDLGGKESYWRIANPLLEALSGRVEVVLLNNEAQPPATRPGFSDLRGDACDTGLLDGEHFDIVHSNSVIEHVGDEGAMARFAENVARLGTSYFVQTPNYWFPLEPHFRVPGFQWLPAPVRIALLQRFNLGFYRRAESHAQAREHVESIRLLDHRMMRRLFPDGEIATEWVFGLPKSIMAIRKG